MAGFPDIFGAFKSQEGSAPHSSADSVFDPTTGLYYNRRNGMWSTDPGGVNVVASPNLQNQAGQSIALANGLQNRFAQLSGRYDQAYADQGAFVDQLGRVISGGAPSVAGGQLQQGLGQIQAQQNSMASGYSGVNAFAARVATMQNAQRAGSTANQDASLLRAHEIAAARNTLGETLAGRVQGSGNMASETMRGGVALRGLASGARGSYETGARDDASKNVDIYGKLASGAGQAVAQGFTGGASGGMPA